MGGCRVISAAGRLDNFLSYVQREAEFLLSAINQSAKLCCWVSMNQFPLLMGVVCPRATLGDWQMADSKLRNWSLSGFSELLWTETQQAWTSAVWTLETAESAGIVPP